MKTLLNYLVLSIFFIFYQSAQQKDIMVIKEFISKASAKSPDSKAILRNFFPAKFDKQKDARGKSLRDSVHILVVKDIHNKLRGVDLSKIRITPYDKEQKGDIKITPISGSQIYQVKRDDKLLFNVLMNNNELISVITLNKGGTGVFAIY